MTDKMSKMVSKPEVDDTEEVSKLSPEKLDDMMAEQFAVEHDGEPLDVMLDDIEDDYVDMDDFDFIP